MSSATYGQETDNELKYERAGGVQGRLLARFKAGVIEEVRALAPTRVLDAGCGEGHVSAWVSEAMPAAEVVGVDGRAGAIEIYRTRNPGATGRVGDLAALPFADDAFDLVLCTEVLEHLPAPAVVLRQLARVSCGHLLLTVPHEPFFRAGNLAAGRYVGRLGSTPGHLSTWGRRGFLRLVAGEAQPVRWRSLFPWQAVVARPRPAGPA
jgi:SAM-dependent methyltransferase